MDKYYILEARIVNDYYPVAFVLGEFETEEKALEFFSTVNKEPYNEYYIQSGKTVKSL